MAVNAVCILVDVRDLRQLACYKPCFTFYIDAEQIVRMQLNNVKSSTGAWLHPKTIRFLRSAHKHFAALLLWAFESGPVDEEMNVSDTILLVIYAVHVLVAFAYIVPRIGASVVDKCRSSWGCIRHLRRAGFSAGGVDFKYDLDLADGQWREFRGSLGILLLAMFGHEPSFRLHKKYVWK